MYSTYRSYILYPGESLGPSGVEPSDSIKQTAMNYSHIGSESLVNPISAKQTCIWALTISNQKQDPNFLMLVADAHLDFPYYWNQSVTVNYRNKASLLKDPNTCFCLPMHKQLVERDL